MSPRTERLLERARALVAEPNNMDVRTRFLAATFNIDRLAAVLVEIDQSRPQGESDGSQVEPSTTGAGRHIPLEPNPWTQWDGGENPLNDIWIEFMQQNGYASRDRAGDVDWHANGLHSIIAYRIIPTDDQGGKGT